MTKKERCAQVKRLHRKRRRKGTCINGDGRKAHKGGRCRACWRRKLASDRASYHVLRNARGWALVAAHPKDRDGARWLPAEDRDLRHAAKRYMEVARCAGRKVRWSFAIKHIAWEHGRSYQSIDARLRYLRLR